MVFNNEDKLWLDVCKAAPDEYRIMISSKQVYVVDIKIDKTIYVFDLNGEELIKQLLEYMGCSVELV